MSTGPPLSWNGRSTKAELTVPGTWSQKYNLVWDQMLDLHLFPTSVVKKEWDFYPTRMQPYGIPLDNRKTITKLDWEVWTASLSTNPQQFSNLVRDLARWSDESSSRVPLTDYYDTVSGKQIHFQARSVVGGIFIKALLDSGSAGFK